MQQGLMVVKYSLSFFLFRLYDAANEFRLNPAPVRFLCMLIVLFLCHFYMVLVN